MTEILEFLAKVFPYLLVAIMAIAFWYIYRKQIGEAVPGLLNRIKLIGPKGIEFEPAAPSVGMTTPVSETKASSSVVELEEETDKTKKYPFDYVFLNHTSFLRPEKQQEFQAITKVYGVDHYDIRVILDSYCRGALEKVERVKYFLHEAYAQYGSAVRERNNPDDKFLLKEIANGEYVLIAEVYLKGEKKPITLQRYITLWKSGPYIERYFRDRQS